MWVGDYTMQPENGGLGVFAHEYGHDLGLPDNYDTSGGDNGTGFWDLMSAGSYLGPGVEDLGARPGDMTAWDKFQLGWLNYEVSSFDERSTHRLGPAEYNTRDAQGLFTLLPDKIVTTVLAPPPEGTYAWYSGRGNDLDNQMTHPLTLPGGTTSLSMSLWYEIEAGWDYFYVSLSNDNGATWSNLSGNRTTTADPNGQNEGNGVTGTSGGVFVPATFDVPVAFTGVPVLLRLRYWTDAAAVEKGVLVDQIVAGTFTDGAEATPNGWTLGDWAQSSGLETSTHFNAYLAEFRQYRSYDTALRTGPYNFGFANTLPNWVEHYPYQDGLLIHYWDTSQADNDTSVHPGEGLILPVDSHPTPLLRVVGAVTTPWSGRVQSHDATFGLEATEPLTLHRLGVPYSYPGQSAQSVFFDMRQVLVGHRRRRTACGSPRPAPSSRCSTPSPTMR